MCDTKSLMCDDVRSALANVFGGQSVTMKRKPIRNLIDKNRPQAEEVIHKYGYDKVVRVVMELLKAKAFPAVHGGTTGGSLEEKEAASTGDCWSIPTADQNVNRCQQCRSSSPSKGATKADLQPLDKDREQDDASSCLIKLPFQAQYELMTQLQTAMEHCCFYFSQKYLPDVLENRGWDCPAATTLDRWMEAIGSSKLFVASHKSGCQSTTAIGEILRSTAHIREVTIHRAGISTERLRKCLESAIALAEVLGQDQQSQQQPELRSLAAQVRSSIQDLEDWDLEQQLFLDVERSNIAKQRAKLDELEAAALKKANHQIEEYQYEVGARVQEAVRNFRDAFPAIPRNTGGTEDRAEKANSAERRSDNDEYLDFLLDAKSITTVAVTGG
ncbi:hypothetical protein X797_011722 [Metarhizium robertsii]|uniref:Ubiquinol-cytochrome-c reductase cytochrome c1 n=1 Tax=Metarhizium robertsii TaxID=568076 RepID=A0A014PI30_9HYPO|nr:hypothetical protein X797_011722 [Metarhizium robertsii]